MKNLVTETVTSFETARAKLTKHSYLCHLSASCRDWSSSCASVSSSLLPSTCKLRAEETGITWPYHNTRTTQQTVKLTNKSPGNWNVSTQETNCIVKASVSPAIHSPFPKHGSLSSITRLCSRFLHLLINLQPYLNRTVQTTAKEKVHCKEATNDKTDLCSISTHRAPQAGAISSSQVPTLRFPGDNCTISW